MISNTSKLFTYSCYICKTTYTDKEKCKQHVLTHKEKATNSLISIRRQIPPKTQSKSLKELRIVKSQSDRIKSQDCISDIRSDSKKIANISSGAISHNIYQRRSSLSCRSIIHKLPCRTCGFVFHTYQQLLNHMKTGSCKGRFRSPRFIADYDYHQINDQKHINETEQKGTNETEQKGTNETERKGIQKDAVKTLPFGNQTLFACVGCGYHFDTEMQLKEHMLVCASYINKMRINEPVTCCKEYHSAMHVANKLSMNKQRLVFQCHICKMDICNIHSYKNPSFMKHYRINGFHTCGLCGKTNLRNFEFVKHMVTAHDNESNACTKCNKICIDKYRFLEHISSAHIETKKCHCIGCQITFKPNKDLEKDTNTLPSSKNRNISNHNEVDDQGFRKIFLCLLCFKTHKSKKARDIHLLTHENISTESSKKVEINFKSGNYLTSNSSKEKPLLRTEKDIQSPGGEISIKEEHLDDDIPGTIFSVKQEVVEDGIFGTS